MQIRILQWNILFKEKIENIVKLLGKLDLDIFCLQELEIDNKAFNPDIYDPAAFIAEKLGFNYYFERAYTYDDSDESEAIGNGIFTKHKIVDTRSFFTQEPGSNPAIASDHGRIYIETDIDLGKNKILNVGTAHLAYVPRFEITDQKRQEVDRLVQGIKNKKDNYVLTGDLNSTPDSYTISELEKYFVSAGPSYDQPTWTTKPFEMQGFIEDKLRWRLDYVFATKDVKVVSSEIVDTQYSDHLPVLVTIEV